MVMSSLLMAPRIGHVVVPELAAPTDVVLDEPAHGLVDAVAGPRAYWLVHPLRGQPHIV